MTRDERMDLVSRIENERGSKVVAYIAGDRRHLETKIADDIFPMIHRHLTQIGQRNRIDLFLYSTGGITIAGYALVNLFREFCGEFNVIVPFKALSAATLIALGANEIMMTKMGQLSPIDPSVHHPLGPMVKIPGQKPKIAPVNVEDVNAFIDLAKQEFRLSEEESLRNVFGILASEVNPLTLGAVQRSREQIAFLASRLMRYHTQDEEHIRATVDTLIRQRFSHSYIISRREAKEELGLNITEPNAELRNLVIRLFEAYNKITMMDRPYQPELELGQADTTTSVFNRAVIESTNLTHVFRTVKEIKRVQVTPPNVPQPTVAYQERPLQEAWVEDNSL